MLCLADNKATRDSLIETQPRAGDHEYLLFSTFEWRLIEWKHRRGSNFLKSHELNTAPSSTTLRQVAIKRLAHWSGYVNRLCGGDMLDMAT